MCHFAFVWPVLPFQLDLLYSHLTTLQFSRAFLSSSCLAGFDSAAISAGNLSEMNL